MNSLKILENKATKIILDAPPLSSATEALKLQELEDINIVVFLFLNVLMD